MKKFKIILQEIIFIIFIFFLGLILGKKALIIFEREKIEIPSMAIGNFLTFFFLGTILILIFLYLPKLSKIKKGIFRGLYFFAGGYGLLFSLFLIFENLLKNFWAKELLVLFFWGLILYLQIKRPTIFGHNLFFSLSLVGVCNLLGFSFGPQNLLFLLAILSIYDFIAVYKTKHMQKMAQEMLKEGSLMGLIFPQKIKDFFKRPTNLESGKDFFVVGGGDIAFPLIFVLSVLKEFGMKKALILTFFSFLGIFFTLILFFSQKERRALPALPPITFFLVLGYLLIYFLL